MRTLAIIGLGVLSCAGLGWAWYAKTSTDLPSAPALAPTPTAKNDLAAPTPVLPLDEADRKYLWDVEHHVLTLGAYGFKPFGKALIALDPAGMTKALDVDFKAQMPQEVKVVRAVTSYAEVTRNEDGGGPRKALSRDEFLNLLMEHRRRFTSPPKMELKVMMLAPVDRKNLDSLWQGTGFLRMWGEMGTGQPGEVSMNWQYEVLRPFEENLARGGWLRSVSITQSQVAHATHVLLKEVAAERGLDTTQFHDNWTNGYRNSITGGVYLCDFDRDGYLDMLIVDLNRIVLYKGLPNGQFRDVTIQMGLPNKVIDSLAAAFVDLDGDGWEDLILGTRIFRNKAGKGFEDVTRQSNLCLPTDAVGLAIADYDRDGHLDLYVTRGGNGKADSWLEGKSGDVLGNQLWRNLGNWQFENVTAKTGTDGGQRSTFTAVWLDANNDGWPDLFVINEFGNGVLYINKCDGTFRPQLLTDGPSDFGSMGVTCGDIDNDGHIDLYLANMYSKSGTRVIGNLRPDTYPPDIMKKMKQFVAGSQLYRNLGDGKFEQLGKRCQVAGVGWAYGAALVDLDNDGFLDLFATCGFVSFSRDEPDG